MKPVDLVWYEGALRPAGEAGPALDDRGFLYGEGAFETIRLADSRPYRLVAHLDRLRVTLADLEIPWSYPESEVGQGFRDLAVRHGLAEGVGRILVSAGPRGADPPWAAPSRSFTWLTVGPLPAPPPEGGVPVVISVLPQLPASPTSRHKSLAYLERVHVRREAHRRGAWEAVRLTPEGYLAEGAMSNLFWGVGGILRTPMLDLGVLPGVTRQAIGEAVRHLGVTLVEGHFTPTELALAEEAFLTNAVAGLVPIARLGDWIPARVPGPLCEQLRRAEAAALQAFRSGPGGA